MFHSPRSTATWCLVARQRSNKPWQRCMHSLDTSHQLTWWQAGLCATTHTLTPHTPIPCTPVPHTPILHTPIPHTAMCSLDWTGWNPTNDICIDSMVPRQYTCNTTQHSKDSFTHQEKIFFCREHKILGRPPIKNIKETSGNLFRPSLVLVQKL